MYQFLGDSHLSSSPAPARPGHDTIWSCYKLAAQLISLPTPGPWSRRENNYIEVKIF